MTEIQSQIPTLLQAKMTQQGKHMRVGSRKGFANPLSKTGFYWLTVTGMSLIPRKEIK
jgi:hypothetical protein